MSEDARQVWEIAGIMTLAWLLALAFGRFPSRTHPYLIKRSDTPFLYWSLMAMSGVACLAVAYLASRA